MFLKLLFEYFAFAHRDSRSSKRKRNLLILMLTLVKISFLNQQYILTPVSLKNDLDPDGNADATNARGAVPAAAAATGQLVQVKFKSQPSKQTSWVVLVVLVLEPHHRLVANQP